VVDFLKGDVVSDVFGKDLDGVGIAGGKCGEGRISFVGWAGLGDEFVEDGFVVGDGIITDFGKEKLGSVFVGGVGGLGGGGWWGHGGSGCVERLRLV
jgi:hypothetical protein